MRAPDIFLYSASASSLDIGVTSFIISRNRTGVNTWFNGLKFNRSVRTSGVNLVTRKTIGPPSPSPPRWRTCLFPRWRMLPPREPAAAASGTAGRFTTNSNMVSGSTSSNSNGSDWDDESDCFPACGAVCCLFGTGVGRYIETDSMSANSTTALSSAALSDAAAAAAAAFTRSSSTLALSVSISCVIAAVW